MYPSAVRLGQSRKTTPFVPNAALVAVYSISNGS
jgi:hypothetical protein